MTIIVIISVIGWIATAILYRGAVKKYENASEVLQTYIHQHKAYSETAMGVINDLLNAIKDMESKQPG